MSEKINILVIPSDRTGVSKFRSVDPHIKLEELYPDDFHVDIDYKANIDFVNDENFLKKYQIIHFHRTLGPYEQMERRMGQLRSLGIKTIMDIDDYWKPTIDHPAYQLILNEKLDQKIVSNLPLPEYIMTTTPIFADILSKYNKKVVIIPNAIDPTERQFLPDGVEKKTDRIRVGWLGGSSHLADLEILHAAVGKLIGGGYDKKTQFVVCGFDVRGEITEYNPQTKEKKKRKITPEETIWVKYEKIFTNKYQTLPDEDYVKYLQTYSRDPYDKSDEDQPYRRIWTRPITTYAQNYNAFDISLAPIKEHIFNKAKSQLKVIEAAFHKKALIAQDFGPYTIDLKSAYEDGHFTKNGNALIVPSIKNHKLWFKYIKLLVDNPSLITDLAERLHEDITPKYNLEKVTRDRAEFYKSIV
jgi:glycosyltransferase involved in cell wall biosynthesis